MKNIIIVDEMDRDMVQKADIEMTSRMNLIAFILSHGVDISNERLQRYENEYQKYFLAFEKAKTVIFDKYVKHLNASSWSLDYESCELTYEL